jgi:hypothetical protein
MERPAISARSEYRLAIGYQEIWAYKPHKGRRVAAPVTPPPMER